MSNKKLFKKIGLTCVLIAIIGTIVFIGNNASKGKKEQKLNTNSTTIEKVAQSKEDNSVVENNEEEELNTAETKTTETKKATETKLDEGVKYSIDNEIKEPEIVVKDNYYDTQISDFNTNFEQYEGKIVQIEGLYFENEDYTFVGRYSTSNLCPYCPTGYSYFEYEWHGDVKPELKDSDSWIKIIGKLKKGNDGVEYYYIDASSIEVMNEKGEITVNN